MMRSIAVLILILIGVLQNASAQLNMSLVGNLDYPVVVNDIWGYVTPAPHNTEYAIMGMFTGAAVISLADPANPTEVAFMPGPNSLWRDIKTWGHYAYVSNESGLGIGIINLAYLSDDSVSFEYQQLEVPDLGEVLTAHNLWVDELGYLYVLGSNINSGGVLIFDLNGDPANPVFKGKGLPVYSHDAYARGNLLYSADIFAGYFSVYDITDRAIPVLINTQFTDFSFTHNVWLSDDGNTLFTTDEQPNAPTGVFDVSDPLNIQRLAAFRPTASLGMGVIPHNAHVKDDFVVISHYTDGVVVFDGKRPQNPVEVGVYDTYPGPHGGFNGAWGAYPFLPSGLVLGSDMQTGLYVLQPSYNRACWLEGNITDADSGDPVNHAHVSILGTGGQTLSQLNGNYYTGYVHPGTYNVKVSKNGYFDFFAEVELASNEVTVLNAELIPLTESFLLQAVVIHAGTSEPLPGAQVQFTGNAMTFEAEANQNGMFSVPGFYEGTYQVIAALWGYQEVLISDIQLLQSGGVLVIEMEPGYQDGFELDQGWQVIAGAEQGNWVRAVPELVIYNNTPLAPGADIPVDIGNKAYLTGLGGAFGEQSLAHGTSTLVSPPIDLSMYDNPVISFHYWFRSVMVAEDNQRYFRVVLYDGDSEYEVYNTSTTTSGWSPEQRIYLSEYLGLGNQIEVRVEAHHSLGGGWHAMLVEAAFDHFRIREFDVVNVAEPLVWPSFILSPNPAITEFTITPDANAMAGIMDVRVFDATGRVVYQGRMEGNMPHRVNTGSWPQGIYLAVITDRTGRMLYRGRVAVFGN